MFLLETERLTITEFKPDMAQAVHENSLDEDNRRFVPDEVFETVEDAAETIDFLMAQYGGTEGPLVYPVLLNDETNIGYVQAVPLGDGIWEIGYHIGAKYTKHGYATEAVKAFMPVIMKKIGISKMAGICLADNVASQKVMENAALLWSSEELTIIRANKEKSAATGFTFPDISLISTAAEWDILLLGGVFYCYIFGIVVNRGNINISNPSLKNLIILILLAKVIPNSAHIPGVNGMQAVFEEIRKLNIIGKNV